LAQNKITKFKGGNIKKYLIFEGIDVVGQVKLLVDVDISPLEETPDGVWLWV
jgi:hypothetical protein